MDPSGPWRARYKIILPWTAASVPCVSFSLPLVQFESFVWGFIALVPHLVPFGFGLVSLWDRCVVCSCARVRTAAAGVDLFSDASGSV